jgi:hypothetical protein
MDQARSQNEMSLAERARQMQALSLAPTFANQDYTDLNALMGVGKDIYGMDKDAAGQNYKWWQESQAFPQSQLDAYGRALGVTGGSGTQTRTEPDPSRASELVGGGLTGLALWEALFGKKPKE